MYMELRVGGQEITISAGSNIAFMVLTGTECAAKDVCGKPPGYDYKNSHTVRKNIDPEVKERIIRNAYIPGVNDRKLEGEMVEDQLCPYSHS